MKKILSRFVVICMIMMMCCATIGTNVAYAAAAEPGFYEELVDQNDIVTRSDKWPDTSWDIATKGKYTGNIVNINNGYGLYTNYYFNCNSAGKLKVTATLTAKYAIPTNSKCIIELYDAVTKELVVSYDPGFEAYLDTVVAHTFTGLKTATPYVVRFYNASGATFENNISGPITVGFP